MSMQIECKLELFPQRAARRRSALTKKAREKVPRITRTLVLAHQIERATQENRLLDYAEVARQIGVTRARVSQIVGLLRLAPAIQERILLGDPAILKHLAESPLRRIYIEPDHTRQAEMFEAIIDGIKAKTNCKNATRTRRRSKAPSLVPIRDSDRTDMSAFD